MTLSVFDLFTIGIGPSSSHTVGPMVAARAYALRLQGRGLLASTQAIAVHLHGSLGATGRAHGADTGVILGLLGCRPDTVRPDEIPGLLAQVRTACRLTVLGEVEMDFDPSARIAWHREVMPAHANGLRFEAHDGAGRLLDSADYYSIGGGFVRYPEGDEPPRTGTTPAPYPFGTAAQLLEHATALSLPISAVMMANERAARSAEAIDRGLLDIWRVMQECVQRGCDADEGHLPGGLGVPRRAPALYRKLTRRVPGDPLDAMDWVSLFALAVNEENAAGGRIVTAPTNGAAGIVPAVLRYYWRFVRDADDQGIRTFLLTAAAIGVLLKEQASISGAEVGCQGEVGSACAMAAAGLTEVLGGTPAQVENAAEIGLEHNLGLTCDPVRGLVQIPCIERNAIGAVKAIAAARMALNGTGEHMVSLDAVIRTMRDTGADMMDKYKETSLGGLAVNVVEC